jgi:hypothetical protein
MVISSIATPMSAVVVDSSEAPLAGPLPRPLTPEDQRVQARRTLGQRTIAHTQPPNWHGGEPGRNSRLNVMVGDCPTAKHLQVDPYAATLTA